MDGITAFNKISAYFASFKSLFENFKILDSSKCPPKFQQPL